MASMWMPLMDREHEERDPQRDDREMGFAMPPEGGAEPRANGDLDGDAVEAGGRRWESVLGW